MKPVIRLNKVWKTYTMGSVSLNALKDTSLEVKKGEFLAILGKSGSGKSTMMNMVGCLDFPTQGEIYLDGKDVNGLSESELAQIRGKKIGFIFQQFNLMPTLTALDNVILPAEFQDVDTDVARERAKKLLKFVDLEDRMHHRPTELSGGQMQRVAIARSLMNDPEIILADEPTGALDSKTGEKVVQMLTELNKQGKSIVIVTHDRSLAQKAKRIIELKDGEIISDKRRTK